MRRSLRSVGFAILVVLTTCLSCEKGTVDPSLPFPIYTEEDGLAFGFGLGEELFPDGHPWVEELDGCFKMDYPAGREWGAVFITVGGDPVDPPRPCEDLSRYRFLSVELRAEADRQTVEVGIKDNTDLDQGKEAKQSCRLTTSWKRYSFELKVFYTADLRNIYVPVEFVFDGPEPRTVYFTNVFYDP